MKAVIVEVRNSHAAVLCDDGRIIKIKNKNYTVGQTINISKKNKYIKFVALAAAAFIVFAVPVYAYLTPYSYVSIDVNPSFELSINRFDRVLKISALNDDGEEVLREIDINKLKNKEIKEAVKNILNKLQDEGYLIEGNEGGVIVATSSKTKEKTDKLASSLKTVVDREVKIQVQDDEEISDETKEENIENKDKENKDIENKDENEVQKEQEEQIEQTLTLKTEAEDKKLKDTKASIEAENKLAKVETDKNKNKSTIQVEVISVGEERVEEAHELNVTPGKLNLVEKLVDAAEKAGVEDLKSEDWLDKSVKEIMEETKKYENLAKDKNKYKKDEAEVIQEKPKNEKSNYKNSDDYVDDNDN